MTLKRMQLRAIIKRRRRGTSGGSSRFEKPKLKGFHWDIKDIL
jgi:hypothetical protein